MNLDKWISNFPKDAPLYYKDGVFSVNAGFVSSRYFLDSAADTVTDGDAFAYSMEKVRSALHDMPVSYRVEVDREGILHILGEGDTITSCVSPLPSRVPADALGISVDLDDAVALPMTDALSELLSLARSSLSLAQRSGYANGYLHVSQKRAWFSAGDLTVLFSSPEGYLPEDSSDIRLSLDVLKYLQRSKVTAAQGIYLSTSHLMYSDGVTVFHSLYVEDTTNVTLPSTTLGYLDATEGMELPESLVSLFSLKTKLTTITPVGVHCDDRFYTVKTGVLNPVYLPNGIAQILYSVLKGNVVSYKDNKSNELLFTETAHNKVVGVF